MQILFPPEIVFGSMIGVPAGMVLFVLGLFWFRRKRLIENIPTSKIRSLAMGLAEIYGQVVRHDKQILRSPMSGDECVYYKYTVEEYRQNNKGGIGPRIVMGENPGQMGFPAGGGSWVMVRHDEERAHFYLKDATGRVLVDPAGANIELKPDYEFSSGFGKDPPQKILSFLESQGINHDGFFGLNKQMRFREYVIREDDKLYILGTAGDNPFVAEGMAKENVEDVMMHKGENEKFFMISDSSERDILGGLKWKVYGGILGGMALTAGCLTLIFLSLEIF